MTNELPSTEPMGRGEVVLYQTGKGAPALDVRLEKDTVWLSQRQMADLFDKDSDTVGLHIRNVLREGELEEGATTEDSSVVQSEGGERRRTKREVRSAKYERRWMSDGEFVTWQRRRIRLAERRNP